MFKKNEKTFFFTKRFLFAAFGDVDVDTFKHRAQRIVDHISLVPPRRFELCAYSLVISLRPRVLSTVNLRV